jgi:hypothetical protein
MFVLFIFRSGEDGSGGDGSGKNGLVGDGSVRNGSVAKKVAADLPPFNWLFHALCSSCAAAVATAAAVFNIHPYVGKYAHYSNTCTKREF